MIKNFLKGLFFGALVGGTGGLLAAPQSGNETRKQLKTYLDETTDATLELNQSVANLKDAVITTRKTIDETIPVVTKSLNQDIEAFKFQANPRLARIKAQINRMNEHVTALQTAVDAEKYVKK